MDSLELLKEFEAVLHLDKEIQEYCADSLNWISARKADWKNDKIRVGVIGVTSSGKSTLINAIFGMDILSSAVAPSSGQIVCCSYGDESSAVVRFEDGSEKVFSGEDFTKDNLMEYSDQRMNPQNIKKVESIELKAPYFEIGKEVILIDSPGLDAYGLEAAEKITLETLVPTIDVCVYVTTMKANSDRKATEVLNTVARYNCPLIIVQNMLDTLRPSSKGDKSREQLAAEHYKRLEDIIQKSEIKDKRQVKIIQLSAEHAKQWRYATNKEQVPPVTEKQYEASRFDYFINVLKDFLVYQMPRINQQRISSIEECICRLSEEITPYCVVSEDKISDVFPLEGLREEIEAFNSKLESDYKKISSRYSKDVKELKGQLKEESFLWHIDEYIKKTNELVNQIGMNIFELIKSGNEFISETADKVNIPVRDLLKSPKLDFYKDIKAEKKKEVIRGRVKDLGIGGFLNRVKGAITGDINLGYHTEVSKTIKTDVDANRKKMLDRLEDALIRYDECFVQWLSDSVRSAMNKILEAVDVSEKAYIARKRAEVQQEKLIGLNESLEQLIKNISEEHYINHVDEEYFDEEYFIEEVPVTINASTNQIEVSNIASDVLRMTKSAVRNQHVVTVRHLIYKEQISEHIPIVIGWDSLSIDELLWQTGLQDALVMDLSKEELTELPSEGSRCMFILVNAIQFGAAQKQIYELELDKKLTDDDFVFWVVQDFQELINCDDVAEGLACMVELQKQKAFNFKSVIWLVHQNPIFNLVYLENQYQPESISEDKDAFMECIKERFRIYCDDDVMKTINDMI